MPKVSVIIPAYNRGDLIAATLDSVLRQTLDDVEIIVVDDGSVDHTPEVVARYGDRIRYHRQENRGRALAARAGFDLARGDYLCFLDSDDLCTPRKLARQADALDSKPNVAFVYSDYNFIDDAGRSLAKPPVYARTPLKRGKIFAPLLHFDFIPPSTVMVRRGCLEAHGLFDPSLWPSDDWDWLLRLSRLYEVDYVAEPLVSLRVHTGNTGSAAITRGTVQVLRKYLAEPETKEALGAGWRAVCWDRWMAVAAYSYSAGDGASFRRELAQALRANPAGLLQPHVLGLWLKSYLSRETRDTLRGAKARVAGGRQGGHPTPAEALE